MISRDRYEPIVARAVAELESELGDDLEGILLGGSVASGTPRERSDIDLYVVVKSPWSQRRVKPLDGIKIDLVVAPASQVRRALQDDDRPETLTVFAAGRVLRDPNGTLAGLVEEARRRIGHLRREPTADEIAGHRLRITELIEDAQDLEDDDIEAANWIVHRGLAAAMDAYYCLARRHPVPTQSLLADLWQNAPDLESRVRRILSPSSTVSSRRFWLESLSREILEPVGGLVEEWNGPRVDLSDGPPEPDGL